MSRRTTQAEEHCWETLVERWVLEPKLLDSEQRALDELRGAEPERHREVCLLEAVGRLVPHEPLPDRDVSRALVERVMQQVDAEVRRRASVQGEGPAGREDELVEAPVAWEGGPGVAPRGEGVSRRRGYLGGAVVAGGLAAFALVGATTGWLGLGLGSDNAEASSVALGRISGEVEYHPPEVTRRLGAPDGRALVAGAVIAAGEGRVCTRLDAAIEVCLSRNTAVRLVDLESEHRLLEVLRGRVVAKLDPLPKGHQFTLAAKDVRVTAVGTVFSVAYDDVQDRVDARVVEGSVRVAAPAATLLLDLHHALAVQRGHVTTRPLTSREAEEDLALFQTEDEEPSSGDVEGTAPLEREVSPEQPALPEREVSPEQQPALPEREVSPARPSSRPPAAGRGEPAAVWGSGARSRVREAEAALVAARSLLERDADRAAAAYRRLVHDFPESSQAHAATVTLGELELVRLRRPSRALRAFDRYLAKGGGPLALQARHGRVEALRQLGRSRAEVQAIRELLRHHPTSGYVPSLQRRLEALTR